MKSVIPYQISSELFIEIEQDFDFTIHSLDYLHGAPPIPSPLFRTNYYTFLFIAGGRGHYTIDHNYFAVQAGCVNVQRIEASGGMFL